MIRIYKLINYFKNYFFIDLTILNTEKSYFKI